MKNKGMTLVEMLMSVAILGMITIYAIPSFTNGISMMRKNKLKEQAVWYLQQEMETLRTTSFDSLSSDTTCYDILYNEVEEDSDDVFYYETVTISTLQTDLKKVELAIIWEWKEVAGVKIAHPGKKVELITIVSEYGINEKLQ